MKYLITLAFAATALPAFAETEMDANADGLVSFDELLEVHPEISTEMFLTLDTDGDALLNAEEIAAAQEAGMLPPEES